MWTCTWLLQVKCSGRHIHPNRYKINCSEFLKKTQKRYRYLFNRIIFYFIRFLFLTKYWLTGRKPSNPCTSRWKSWRSARANSPPSWMPRKRTRGAQTPSGRRRRSAADASRDNLTIITLCFTPGVTKYHSVCPLVGIGTPPPTPSPPQASLPPFPRNQRRVLYTLVYVWGGGVPVWTTGEKA